MSAESSTLVNPVHRVLTTLRSDLRREDLADLCDAELAEFVEQAAWWCECAKAAQRLRKGRVVIEPARTPT